MYRQKKYTREKHKNQGERKGKGKKIHKYFRDLHHHSSQVAWTKFSVYRQKSFNFKTIFVKNSNIIPGLIPHFLSKGKVTQTVLLDKD